MSEQIIDTDISRQKFETDIAKLKDAEANYRARGIFVIKAEFPDVIIAFMAPQLAPASLIFATLINYSNYDLEPLSVRFINLFTLQDQIQPVNVLYKIEGVAQLQNYVQQDEVGLPFLCLPGVKEYHEHPAHSGDNWFLHRNVGGEGSLGYIIDKLYLHGVKPINSFSVPINIVAQIPNAQLNYDTNLLS
jgi:hypothetical protein